MGNGASIATQSLNMNYDFNTLYENIDSMLSSNNSSEIFTNMSNESKVSFMYISGATYLRKNWKNIMNNVKTNVLQASSLFISFAQDLYKINEINDSEHLFNKIDLLNKSYEESYIPLTKHICVLNKLMKQILQNVIVKMVSYMETSNTYLSLSKKDAEIEKEIRRILKVVVKDIALYRTFDFEYLFYYTMIPNFNDFFDEIYEEYELSSSNEFIELYKSLGDKSYQILWMIDVFYGVTKNYSLLKALKSDYDIEKYETIIPEKFLKIKILEMKEYEKKLEYSMDKVLSISDVNKFEEECRKIVNEDFLEIDSRIKEMLYIFYINHKNDILYNQIVLSIV